MDTSTCNGYRSSTLQSSLICLGSSLIRARWSTKQPPSTTSTWTYSTPPVTREKEYCSTQQVSQANSMRMSRQIRILGDTFLRTLRYRPMIRLRQELKRAHSSETSRRVSLTSRWRQTQRSPWWPVIRCTSTSNGRLRGTKATRATNTWSGWSSKDRRL